MTVASVIDEPVRGFIPDIGFLSLSGLERGRAMVDGRVPWSPVQHLTGVRTVQVTHGSCTAMMPASPWLQTQAGFFLSGVTALVADFALGGAIASALPPWTYPVTSDINFTYLRPIRVDAERLIARGRLIDAGRNQATSEALVEDGLGRVLAHATTRCFVRTMDPQEAAFRPAVQETFTSPSPFERPIDPADSISTDLSGMSGLEVLNAIANGNLPAPAMKLTGQSFEPGLQRGRISSRHPASPWFVSPAGTIYGGVLAYMADELNTAAATSTLEAGTATASLDLKVHFLRPGLADGSPLRGDGEVVHEGKGLIVTRAEVRNGEGKRVVSAVGSFMNRRIRDWVPVVG